MQTQDYLFEDPPVSNQKFVCISVLTPKNFKEQTSMHTLKVRGTYDTYEEAGKRAEFLRNIDSNINTITLGWLIKNPLLYCTFNTTSLTSSNISHNNCMQPPLFTMK